VMASRSASESKNMFKFCKGERVRACVRACVRA
jgi:hypothetical protein